MHERFFLRLISKKAVLYSEMISTGALIHGNCDYQLDFNKEEHPVAVQFGGSSPQELSPAVGLYAATSWLTVK